jgi:hypothetical protein
MTANQSAVIKRNFKGGVNYWIFPEAMRMEWTDPIVEDVRASRENIWKACGCDLDRVCEMLRESQASHSSMVVTRAEFSGRHGQRLSR